MKKFLSIIAGALIFLCCTAQKTNSKSVKPAAKKKVSLTTKSVKKILINKNSSMDTKKVLEEIWTSSSFISGDKYFWLFNYEFFRFLEAPEFKIENKEPAFNGLTIFAVADYNADKEPRGHLLYDKDFKIFINYYEAGNKGPKEIANNINELFGTTEITKCLITQKDKDFWSWNESSFHTSSFANNVPKGVLPKFDLRHYFKDSLPGTFITYHEDFDRVSFMKHFAQYNVDSLIPNDFVVFRTSDTKLLKLIDTINSHLGEEVFYLVDFNPSGYWGVGNYKVLNSEQKKYLKTYGLLSNAK